MTETKQQQTPKKAKKFAVLSGEDFELYEFARTAGILMDAHVFRILLEMLRLDISPIALFDVLQDMIFQSSKSSGSKKNSDIKTSTTHISAKKKPPVAAKPKKVKNSLCESKSGSVLKTS